MTTIIVTLPIAIAISIAIVKAIQIPLQVAISAVKLPALVIRRPVIPVIQIALQLPAILGDFLAIALDVAASAPISIIRKQAACSQPHHQQNSRDGSFHSPALLALAAPTDLWIETRLPVRSCAGHDHSEL
jgi:hypothetical protein